MDNILKLMDEYIRHEKIEELKLIKAEIQGLDLGFVEEEFQSGISYGIKEFNQILNKHIKELEKE